MCHTDYEFIHRMTRSLFGDIPDEAINHGFSQRRPIRSVQIPTESGKSPTDFTDIHRFFLGRFHRSFFCHADFADDAIFFLMGFFIHRMTRNLFGGFLLQRLLTDFRGYLASGQWLAPEICCYYFLSRRFRK